MSWRSGNSLTALGSRQPLRVAPRSCALWGREGGASGGGDSRKEREETEEERAEQSKEYNAL